MRGEDTATELHASTNRGSPPHARGRHEIEGCIERVDWITPACAGKTRIRDKRRQTLRDHPRMRGEDILAVGQAVYGLGSPPHARGRLARPQHLHKTVRITPACAGKTILCRLSRRGGTDHPRMRGEDEQDHPAAYSPTGSPPHARGRPLDEARGKSAGGITPACAGKTHATSAPARPFPDHPRMRGEDATINTLLNGDAGSPPHARGRRRDCGSKSFLKADHPRMRGEDPPARHGDRARGGSPPHARGRRR